MMTAFIVILVLVMLAGVYYYSRGPSVIDQLEQTQTPQPSEAKPEEVQILPTEPVAEAQVEKPKRTRAARGQFRADNPATPDLNEAFEGGKSPKKLRKLPADYELEQMKKPAIVELALERGLYLNAKLTKAQMITELKAFKPAKARKQ